MAHCRHSHGRQRVSARERLQFVNPERVAVKLARDFAVHVAKVTTGDETLPANHSGLRDGLRTVIAENLRRAMEQL